MTSILVLGFLIGIRHAFEPDHLAAVTALVSGRTSLRQTLRQGAVWGLGHTTTLFLICGVVIFMETAVSDFAARMMEAAVGVLLIGLGATVIRRVIRDRIHFHAHRHADGRTHFHAHSHKHEPAHSVHPRMHDHGHVRAASFPFRFFVVGLMHGMAGSAALAVMTAQTATSPWLALAYVALFGIGSMVGMAAFTAAISLPLSAARSLTWAHNGLQAAIGFVTVGLGGATVVTSLFP
ncbi:MAG: urease accessory protein [Rhodospirillales bacterium CG15_BIG_FIL_POST_REV_8_21_14_020_66_15]|nr:MAG: urease accessory protein [Rhodospirillales bacterium CG15_BIG_FIL_POST_REV_8_21_14_020_66_15]